MCLLTAMVSKVLIYVKKTGLVVKVKVKKPLQYTVFCRSPYRRGDPTRATFFLGRAVLIRTGTNRFGDGCATVDTTALDTEIISVLLQFKKFSDLGSRSHFYFRDHNDFGSNFYCMTRFLFKHGVTFGCGDNGGMDLIC